MNPPSLPNVGTRVPAVLRHLSRLAACGLAACGLASASSFTSGNIAVFQAEASATNTTANIVEIQPSTALQTSPGVQTLAIPTTGATGLHFSGSATSTGYLSLTGDGTLLSFNGVNDTVSAGNVNALNPRGVGTFNPSGTYNLATTYTGTLTGSPQTRSATSLNNVSWFIADQNGLYTNSASGPTLSGNLRSLKVFGNTVYAFTSSTTTSTAAVGTLASPTATSMTALPGLPATVSANQDFYMISSGSNGTAFDVLYILAATSNTAGTITKYSLVSGSWTTTGSPYTTAFGGFGMAAAKSGAGAVLYVSTGQGALTANNVLKITDTAGYNAAINITTVNNVTLYTAPTGKIVKGVAFAPVAAAVPALTGTATANAFTTTYGTASAAQTFPVTGSNLTANITATAPAGFEVSSDGTTFASTATFTQSAGSASGTLSVRLATTATVVGSYNAKTISLTSAGAATVNITTSASGNIVNTKSLAITANNVTKSLGAVLTGGAGSSAFISTGLVGGETIGSVTIAYGAGAASTDPAGSYAGSVTPSAATGGTFVATNYAIAYVAGDITVSPAIALTINGLTADNKVYDRTTIAALSGTPSLVGVQPADAGNVTLSGTPVATFATASIGTSKAVIVTGYTLTGSAAAGYTLTQPVDLTANIIAAPLTISAAAVTPKTFDGNTNAVITGTLTGVISPDVVTFSGTGTFASSAVGTGIAVTSTSTIGGVDAGNYSLTQPTGLTGNITAPAFSTVNLSNYVRVGRYSLPEPSFVALPPGTPSSNLLAQEASAVTYDWDTDTLFVVGDGGRGIVQVSKTGVLIDTMTLALGSSPQGTDFYDPEGLTYIGGGEFVMTEERDRQLVKFTYVAGTTLNRAAAKTVKLGTFVDNIGLEGVSYDPQSSGFICFKEVSPQGIFQTGIDWNAGTATNGSPTTVNSVDLFNPGLLNLLDIADGFALSNLPALNGQPDSTHIVVLSQESGKIVNTDRNGTIYSSLTIHSDPGNPLNVSGQQHEGLTMDNSGNLYVVSENGGGDINHPQLWVYAPSNVPNAAPSAVALANTIPNIVENTSTIAPVRVADIVITDDGLGVNNLTVSGADAASFQITGDSLYIKAGVVLDYETKTSYSVTVNVDDTTLGGTPDAFVNFNLAVTDVVNETPQAPAVFISEVNATGSSTVAYGADWFELTNNGGSALDITGWQMDDNSNGTAKVPLRTVTSIPAGKSAIFIEGAADGSTDATILSNFCTAWFGQSAPPAGVLIGFYGGSGVGLSSGGDAVNVFDAAGNRMAGVSFGISTTGFTFDNHAGLSSITLPLPTISTPSAVGVNAAFSSTASPAEVGSPGITGKVIISEVAPWSSSNSPVAADWFELTNLTAATLDLTGWQMDDNSNGTAKVPMSGITAIAPGESVIFIETATLSTTAATFRNNWFGASPPATLQIGAYSGGGVGLSTSGDAVNVFDAAGAVQARVDFGANSASPFRTFDNAAGLNNVTISALSAVGVNGAFTAVNSALETGSPGSIVNPPVLVTVAATDASAAESGSNTGTFRITRTGATTAALNVSYTIATGAGQAATTDYAPALSGTAVIPIGASFVDITITPVDDTIVESDETVALTITDTANYDLGATTTASVTIADNDAALASFTVSAGDVTTTSAVIWAKVGALGAANFELFSDAGLTTLVNSSSASVTDSGIPLKWPVASLTANTPYFYRVTDSASTAKTGKFKTALAANTIAGLRFGISGDQRGELAPYPSVKNAAGKNLDFFLQFGDNIYADVSSPNVPLAQARTLSEYRAKFNEVYSTRYAMNTLADLRASTAILAMIDDHEVTNDFSGGALRTTDSRFSADTGTYINETQTFLNGSQAFNEYHPIAAATYGATGDPVTANKQKLYRYSVQGKTAATFVLDTRSFRSAPLTPVTNIADQVQVGTFLASSFTPGRTLLGAQQKADFKADLLAAQAAGVIWKFVCCPEPIQNFGVLGAEDRYEGYAAERTELLKFIDDNKISNVVFVTADFHGTVVNRLSYQTAAFGPQIQTNSIEVVTGAIAYDKPFGPTIVDLAIAAGLAAPGTDLYYQSLDGVSKEALVFGNIINPSLTALGYNTISQTSNPLPNAHLIGGLYTATNSYGWTEFTIDPTTQELNVKTWGIAPYSMAQLDSDPSGVTGRTPAVVSEFALSLKPSFNALATTGLTAQSHGATINLASATGAFPAGGVFSGPGVTAGVFDPATTPPGLKTITYTTTDSFGSQIASTFTIDEKPITFTGVASGDADSSSAVLWTRINEPVTTGFTAQVATDLAFTAPVSFTGNIDASKDYTAKLNVTGLASGTTHYYRFVVDTTGETSLVGKFKTAPAPSAAAPLHFAFSGDNDGLMRPYALASVIPGQNLDFYVNLGDVIYENASNLTTSGAHNGAPWLNSPSVTLSNSALNLNGVPVAGTTFATQAQLKTDYEKKYRENFLPVNNGGQNSLQGLYAAQGNYTTWDNHELGNRKYIDGGAPAGGSVGGPLGTDMPTGRGVDARNNGAGNPGNINDVNTSSTDIMNRAVGFQTLRDVFLSYQPIADRGTISAPSDPRTHGTKRLYSAQQWGKNALYINTDARSYRDIRLKTANGGADETTAPRANNPSRTYLGVTQLTWIKQSLLDAQSAGTKWKFVSISDPMDQLGPIGGALTGTLTSVNSDGGKAFMGGYRAERNDLLKFIADNQISNVVFLATDDHQNRINELSYSPTGQTEVQSSYVKVPYCFSIVCGPLGATGPDSITNHSFSNIKAIADSLANAQSAVGIDPVGLVGYPGLKNLTRVGHPTASTAPEAVDFYSPDTFNFTVLDVSADGNTLSVSSVGMEATAQNAGTEYANGPQAQTIFSFQIDAPTPLQAWITYNFGSSGTGSIANNEDFDGDGIQNLVEYALGINPTLGTGANGPAALPVGITGDSDPLLTDRLALSFNLANPNPSDITYTVQATDDLGVWADVASKTGTGSWTWLGSGAPHIVTSGTGPVSVKIGDIVPTSGNSTRMMRLKVTNP